MRRLWDYLTLAGEIQCTIGRVIVDDPGNMRVYVNGYGSVELDELDSLATVGPSVAEVLKAAMGHVNVLTYSRNLSAEEQLIIDAFEKGVTYQSYAYSVQVTRSPVTDSKLFKVRQGSDGKEFYYSVPTRSDHHVVASIGAPNLVEVLNKVSLAQQLVIDNKQDSLSDLLSVLMVKHPDDFCDKVADMIQQIGSPEMYDAARQYILNVVGVMSSTK